MEHGTRYEAMEHSMKKKRAFFILFQVLFWLLVPIAYTDAMEALIINVVDGHFLCCDYDIALADSEKPIAVGYVNGKAIVQVEAEDGVQTIDFGEAQIALTQNAAQYVTELEYDLEDRLETHEICPVCKRSAQIGNHTLLPCGHWGCRKPADHLQICTYCHGYLCHGKDHSLCTYCKVHWCMHVDLECPYTRNPAPTAFQTVGPDNKLAYFRIMNGGAGYEGQLGIEAEEGDEAEEKEQKEQGWAPQDSYMETRMALQEQLEETTDEEALESY